MEPAEPEPTEMELTEPETYAEDFDTTMPADEGELFVEELEPFDEEVQQSPGIDDQSGYLPPPPMPKEQTPLIREIAKPKKSKKANLLDLMHYLKSLTDSLPDKQKDIFNKSEVRHSMEYVIGSLEGRGGLLKEALKLKPFEVNIQKEQTDK